MVVGFNAYFYVSSSSSSESDMPVMACGGGDFDDDGGISNVEGRCHERTGGGLRGQSLGGEQEHSRTMTETDELEVK